MTFSGFNGYRGNTFGAARPPRRSGVRNNPDSVGRQGYRSPLISSYSPRLEGSSLQAQRPARLQALEGIRALAILAVVFYHLRPTLLPGGFIGVTVFFVLSGFLITSSLDRELTRFHRVSLKNFYQRRFIRLWPPVLVTILFTAALTYLLAPSLFLKAQSDTLPAALFVSNWTYIFRDVSYFAAAGLPSPLTHIWYLGVLAQFYLLWPVVFVFLRKRIPQRHQLMAVIVGLIVLSGLLMAVEFAASEEISRAYYGLDARLGELLIGALAALYYRDPNRPSDIVSPRLSVHLNEGILPVFRSREFASYGVVFLAIFVLLARGESPWMYCGGFLFVALAAAFLIVGVHHPASGVVKVLELPPLTYLGSRSYSLYLVHYPILLVMNPATRTIDPSIWTQFFQVMVAIVCAEVFYQLVEKPTGWILGSRAQHKLPTAGSGRMPRGWQIRPGNSGRLRASTDTLRTVCISLTGVATVVSLFLSFAPLNWKTLADERAIKLRPELAASPNSTSAQADSGDAGNQPGDSGKPDIQKTAAPLPQELLPQALKIPANLNTEGWVFDPATNTCNANAIIIGDSVTMGAADSLKAALPQSFVDGQGNRKLPEGLAAFQAAKSTGFQEKVTVISLGTNSLGNEEPVIRELIDAMNGGPIYFVTLRSPYPNAAENNEIIRRVAQEKDNVGLIDWEKATEGHSEYLIDDGIHLTLLGIPAYTQLIRQALCGR